MDIKLQSSLDEIQNQLLKIIDREDSNRYEIREVQKTLSTVISNINKIHKHLNPEAEDTTQTWENKHATAHAKEIKFLKSLKEKIPDNWYDDGPEKELPKRDHEVDFATSFQKEYINLKEKCENDAKYLKDLLEVKPQNNPETVFHPKHENKPGSSFEISVITLNGRNINLLDITKNEAIEIIKESYKDKDFNAWNQAVINQLSAKFLLPKMDQVCENNKLENEKKTDDFVNSLLTDSGYVDEIPESTRSLLLKYNKQFNCIFHFSHPYFGGKKEITENKDIVSEFGIFGNAQYSDLYSKVSIPFITQNDISTIATDFKDESIKNKELFSAIRYQGVAKAYTTFNNALTYELNKHNRYLISDYLLMDLQKYVDLLNRVYTLETSIKKMEIQFGPLKEIDGVDTDIANAHMEVAGNRMRDLYIEKLNKLCLLSHFNIH